MTLIYCLRCKKQTETVDEVEALTANKRNILKGKCEECGVKKNRFIKKNQDPIFEDKTEKSFINRDE